MPKRTRLTDTQIESLPRKTSRYALPDPELIGHYLRVPARTSRAPISFTVVARDPNGRQVWTTLGNANAMGVEQARARAREAIEHIKLGRPTTDRSKPTVRAVAAQWLERQVKGNGFRTARETERIIGTYILPRIGNRVFADVRRLDVAEFLDSIEDQHGKPTAESVLKVYRAISRWLEQRDESYRAPLTTGMSRVPKAEKRRKRVLSDEEIRKVWCAADGPYGAFIKLALLTAQRKDKLRTLRWDDIHGSVWVIRTEAREKGNPGQLRLPQIAIDIIKSQPKFVDNPYVFAGRKGRPSAAFNAGYYKAQFDQHSGVKNWRVHDLRRSARSLMAKAGVQTEIAERILGHAQDELIETYDRHDYQDEMADALKRLAALIEQIVDPQPNVVALQSRSGT
jgi:integrase